MLYRPYTPADFAALYVIEEVCFKRPQRFGKRLMRNLLANPDSAAWIAEENGSMAGFALVEWEREEDFVAAYLETIELLPVFRGQGAGAELLRCCLRSALLAGATLFWLHVEAANVAALKLYERFGFVPREQEENYYGRGRHALILLLDLGQDPQKIVS
ncbi:GNAT family N-acetyltransferase [Telmatobacter bradus]|uniref:GNAT family N-acetyltransferase n=1 Tax=Telmatobacter bradus TaxID=474953 RepID=UPI003B427C92